MKKRSKLAAAFAQLDALYARLPTVACRGLCAISCGTIPLTDLEASRLQLATHIKPRTVIKLLADGPPSTERPRDRCIYLREDRCTAYAAQPLICRAYGVVKVLSCPHGCVPSRWLPDLELAEIAQAIERLGGGRTLNTCEGGMVVAQSFASLPLKLARGREHHLEEDAERTRGLRALHGGRIIAAIRERG